MRRNIPANCKHLLLPKYKILLHNTRVCGNIVVLSKEETTMADYIEEAVDMQDDDSIITLTSASGEEIDFVEIAGIALRGNFYVILQPVELLEGMGEDEALVFKAYQSRDGEDHFDIELDDEIINEVFEEYYRLLDEQE
jgi:hypothetical protein